MTVPRVSRMDRSRTMEGSILLQSWKQKVSNDNFYILRTRVPRFIPPLRTLCCCSLE